MGQHRRAIGLAVLMVVSVAAPAMGAPASVESLSVDVAQSDDVTVTVTNGTANGTVTDASVEVVIESENLSYRGAGTYTTDANGTVSLPAPEETVRVSITASTDGVSETVTTNLTAGTGNGTMPFGLQVASFVSELNDTDGPRGLAIASWVTANHPGNGSGPPDHAGPGNETRGPPDHAGNGTENGTQGPPDHAGNNETGNQTGGPPDHAGGDEGSGNSGNGNGGNGNSGNGNGGNSDGGNGGEKANGRR